MENEYFIIKQDGKFLIGQFLSYDNGKEVFHAYGIDNNKKILESTLYSLSPKEILLKIEISRENFLELERLHESNVVEFEKKLIEMTDI